MLQVLQGKLLGTDQSQNPVKQCGQADDTEVLIEKTIAGNQNEGKLKTNVSRNDKAVSKAVSSVKSKQKTIGTGWLLPARGADHDVGAVVLQHLLVLGDGQTSEEHSNLKIFLKTLSR